MTYLFEDFDVGAAKRDLAKNIENVRYDVEEELRTQIMDNEIWQSDSRDKMEEAFDTLLNERYPHLKSKLDTAMTILNYVEIYKSYVASIRRKEAQISKLKPATNTEESFVDNQGITQTRTVYHENDQRQINELQRQIEEDKVQLEHYKNIILSMVASF